MAEEDLSLGNLPASPSGASPMVTQPCASSPVQSVGDTFGISHSAAPPTTPTSAPIGSIASNIFRRYTTPNSSTVAVPELSIAAEDSKITPKEPIVIIGGQNSAFKRVDNSPLHPNPPSILKPSPINGALEETAHVHSPSQPSDTMKGNKSGRSSRKVSKAPQPPVKAKMAPKNKASNGKLSRGNESLVQRPCQAHSFHTDAAEVQKMERELLKLLDDFNSGKLRAFGHECSMEQMEAIRDQQENLARLHFELGAKQELSSSMWSSPEDGVPGAKAGVHENNMDRLMDKLERLSAAIGQLNPVGFNTVSEKGVGISTPSANN